MKTKYTIALSMLAGIAIGAFAIERLHAQATPPVYLVTEVDVTNPEGYANEFAPGAQRTIQDRGGRPIAVGGAGGAGAKGITWITGAPAPKRAVIHRWDSLKAVTDWFTGDDYQKLLRIGEKYATFRGYVIDGVE